MSRTCSSGGPVNNGPCGPAPCSGECRGEPVICVACNLVDRVVPAEVMSVDLDNLCHPCASEMGAEIVYWISAD